MPRQLTGKVVSDKMQKTVVVEVSRIKIHPVYKKQIIKKKKFKVHNDKEAKTGDEVKILETRPVSKEKHWKVAEILKKLKD